MLEKSTDKRWDAHRLIKFLEVFIFKTINF